MAGELQVHAINRLALSAALLCAWRVRDPRGYQAEERRLRRTQGGRRVLQLAQHPEELRSAMAVV